MKQYLDLLKEILTHGKDKDDRTGVGTRSLFAKQLRFNLKEGFPLLTTKKVHFKSVVHELLWFIHGETNIARLTQNNVRIWNEWADKHGNLGPVYGSQFRRQVQVRLGITRQFDLPPDLDSPIESSLGNFDNTDSDHSLLYPIWSDMIDNFGEFVCPQWLIYENFQREAKKLPRWNLKKTWPNAYSLNATILYDACRYSPETCIWASEEELRLNDLKPRFIGSTPLGKIEVFENIREPEERFGIKSEIVVECLENRISGYEGWSFRRLASDEFVTFLITDQLRETVADVIHNPNSRRLLMSLWNPADVPYMALPPCHGIAIQFYVSGNELSCQMYQRSCDVFLGLPFNIASYALLLEMVAHMAGLVPSELIITLGDVHIYKNHFDQVNEQLSRKPKDLPTLKINDEKKDIFDLRYEDISLIDYDPDPVIQAQVAV